MRYSTDKRIHEAVKGLVKTGQWFVKSTKRHTRIENTETRQCFTVPQTPSDHRAVHNWFHQVRRAGITVSL